MLALPAESADTASAIALQYRWISEPPSDSKKSSPLRRPVRYSAIWLAHLGASVATGAERRQEGARCRRRQLVAAKAAGFEELDRDRGERSSNAVVIRDLELGRLEVLKIEPLDDQPSPHASLVQRTAASPSSARRWPLRGSRGWRQLGGTRAQVRPLDVTYR